MQTGTFRSTSIRLVYNELSTISYEVFHDLLEEMLNSTGSVYLYGSLKTKWFNQILFSLKTFYLQKKIRYRVTIAKCLIGFYMRRDF